MVKVGDVDCSDIDIDEYLSLSYHPKEGVPGLRLRLRKMCRRHTQDLMQGVSKQCVRSECKTFSDHTL